MRNALLALLLPLLACTDKPVDSSDDTASDADTDTDTDADSDADTDSDTDTDAVAPPCAGGTWGDIDSAQVDGAIHVWAGADSGGDGSGAHPFQTLDDALTASRQKGASRLIAVWPGTTYSSFLDLSSAQGDDGLAIQGCSAAEVTIEAVGTTSPVIKVSEASGVDLRGLTLSGGKRGLWVWQGATVTLTDIEAIGNRNVGIIIDGVATTAAFSHVVVTDPLVNGDAGGFGIQVQNALVAMDDVEVTGATEDGIVVTGMDASATMNDVRVTGTSVDVNGEFGRGIMVQERASVSIQFATLSGNADAGLFGLGASVVELADVTVSDTLGAKLPGSEDTSGDGIVVSDDPANGPYQTDAFTGSADRVTIDGYERAGVLLSGSGLAFTTLSPFIISGHTGAVDDPGAGEPVVQSEATLVSDDAYVTLDVAVPFTPDPAPTDALEP